MCQMCKKVKYFEVMDNFGITSLYKVKGNEVNKIETLEDHEENPQENELSNEKDG